METTGTVDFVVQGETYQTWYIIFGDLKTSGTRPLVALHGGPGMSHHYMLPFKAVYERSSTPVILYDQLGNGKSSHIHDKPKSFWTPDLFVDELDNLITKLGISNDYNLVGQSWGGMLAAYFAANRQPRGLRRLVLSNPPSSMELFMEGANKLLERFPQEQVTLIREHESKDDLKALEVPEYQKITTAWCQRHICVLDPWPADLMASFNAAKEDPTVHQALMGGFNFKLVGNLRKFSVIDDLHKITQPTLLIASPEDEIQPNVIQPFFDKIDKVKWIEFPNSSHLPHLEEPDKFFDVVLGFLGLA